MLLRHPSRKCKFRRKVSLSRPHGSNKRSLSRPHGSNKRSRRTNSLLRPHLRAWQHSKPNRHKDVPLTEP